MTISSGVLLGKGFTHVKLSLTQKTAEGSAEIVSADISTASYHCVSKPQTYTQHYILQLKRTAIP